MELNKQAYDDYVKEITPAHPLGINLLRAFILGGSICALGQVLTTGMMNLWGMEKEAAAAWTLLELILLSVILTGFNLFSKLAKWGGAGILVPITGFANGVVAPAIEYKAEGHVFGIGCKIFTIAGPVILYGILTSWVLGLLYWLGGLLGIIPV